jgi:hypothetical protein
VGSKEPLASRTLVRIALVCIFSTVCGTVAAAEPVYSPAAVKAAFLHRFASYVAWPGEPTSDDPFTIAVAGADEVAEQLESLLPGLTIQNRPARIRRVAAADDLAGVHILYVGHSVQRARSLIVAAASKPILTVTDDDEGLTTGSVINFVKIGRNIRFEISLSAAERSRLRIDSGLLSVAARVHERPRAQLWQQWYFARRRDSGPWYRERGSS